MIKIGVLSDTHHTLDTRFIKHIKKCDEIWHAGDIGSLDVVDQIRRVTKLKAVYGNIDNSKIRIEFNKIIYFKCEGVSVLMTHIGGYPGRYKKGIKDLLKEKKPDIFICGHSHILKVMFDQELGILHMNPGACGDYGIHQVKTMLTFIISGNKIMDLKIIEIPRY